MGGYTDAIYEKIDEAALNAETTPAEPGYFHLTIDPDDENFRQEILGWKIVHCEYGFPNREFLRFPVTAQGVILGNPFVELPDGSIEMGGPFFGGGYIEPFANLDEYIAFARDQWGYMKSRSDEDYEDVWKI